MLLNEGQTEVQECLCVNSLSYSRQNTLINIKMMKMLRF